MRAAVEERSTVAEVASPKTPRASYFTAGDWRLCQLRDLIDAATRMLRLHFGWGLGSVYELAPATVGDLAGKVYRWREEVERLEGVLDD